MIGRKTDYVVAISGYSTATCSFCRKRFRLNAEKHVYKRDDFGGRKNYCSYRCMRAWEKQQQEKDKSKSRSAVNPLTGVYEKKTLQEWAEEAEVDYEKLWYKNVVNKIPLLDAIEMLQLEVFLKF